MRIKFLGTGSGKTSLNRFHSSFIITSTNYNLLVGCGDGISKAILKQKIDLNSIDAILISHFHADHFSGLLSLLTQMKLISRENELKIFVHPSEKDFIEGFIFHSYLFMERMNFNIKIISFNEENQIKVNENFYFTSKLNSHLDKYKKYDSENKLGFVSLSFYFWNNENSVIYSGDVGSHSDLFLFNEKADWYITETTHIKIESLHSLIKNPRSTKLILTHIGDDFEKPLTDFYKSLSENEKSNIILAFDGLELN